MPLIVGISRRTSKTFSGRNKMKKLLFLFIFVVLLSGCVTTWKQVGGNYSSKEIHFAADLPNGWMQLHSPDFLLITRDGILLQNIIIKRMELTEELDNSKKKFRSDMLPHEQAELIIDDFTSNQSMLNFQLLENRPVTIDGHKGFRIVFTYKNEDGLRVKSIYNGVMVQDWFYSIRYTAAARYYFDKDLDSFEKTFNSFKLYAL